MYSLIVNPKTNRKVSIKSRLGKSILRNYLQILSGGSDPQLRAQTSMPEVPRDFSSKLEDYDATTATASIARVADDTVEEAPMIYTCGHGADPPTDKCRDLHSCNDARGANLGRGAYKVAYELNCDNKEVLNTFGGDKAKCSKGVFLQTNRRKTHWKGPTPDRGHYVEITKQDAIGGPVIHRYGACNDSRDWFSIQEKYYSDMLKQANSAYEEAYKSTPSVSVLTYQLMNDSLRHHFQELFKFIHNKLHSAGMAHYDIKPDNIVINVSPGTNTITQMALIDYAMAGSITTTKSNPFGTRDYIDPARFSHVRLPPSGDYSDIWSLGITLFVIYTATFGNFDMTGVTNTRHAQFARKKLILNELCPSDPVGDRGRAVSTTGGGEIRSLASATNEEVGWLLGSIGLRMMSAAFVEAGAEGDDLADAEFNERDIVNILEQWRSKQREARHAAAFPATV